MGLGGQSAGLSVEVTGVRVQLLPFRNLATSFTPLCLCLSKETLKAVGPFYLVSMSGEVRVSSLFFIADEQERIFYESYCS